jgi:hypothetical protein
MFDVFDFGTQVSREIRALTVVNRLEHNVYLFVVEGQERLANHP